MAKRIPADRVQKACELRREGKSTREIARALKIDRRTVQDILAKYAPEAGGLVGGPPMGDVGKLVDRTDIDGSVELLRLERPATVEELMRLCKLDPTKWMPQFFKPNIWQGYGKFKGPNGERFEKVNLYQSKLVCKRVVPEEMEDAILEFVRKHVKPIAAPAARLRRPEVALDKGFMVTWGFWDAHLGMYAWNSEVGSDFDMKIAVNRIYNSIDDMAAELKNYPIERIVLPIGNDFMHFDSVRMTTALGDHFLDTDTRFAKVYLAGLECLSYMVERALELAPKVEILYVPGNHDTTVSLTLCAALRERYRLDPRVHCDLRMNPRKYVRHGGTIVGFDHGGDATSQQLALVFATEAREDWSESTYREVQVGHKHQRREVSYSGVVPTNGVLIRTNPCLSNVDAWHHKQALVGEPVKSVEAWRYDRTGYRGSHVTWARDVENARARKDMAAIR